jgi:hypothetical protein
MGTICNVSTMLVVITIGVYFLFIKPRWGSGTRISITYLVALLTLSLVVAYSYQLAYHYDLLVWILPLVVAISLGFSISDARASRR